MTCEETTELISQFVDDVLPLPVRVGLEQHLDRCPVCRAHVAEFRVLSRSLRQLTRPAPPADLALSASAIACASAEDRRHRTAGGRRQHSASSARTLNSLIDMRPQGCYSCGVKSEFFKS